MSSKSEEINEVSEGVAICYNIKDYQNNINFLFDYSKCLFKNEIFDPNILQWQKQNHLLLKGFAYKEEFIKKKIEEYGKNLEESKEEEIDEEDGFFQLNLQYGNYNEDKVVENLIKNISRTKKRTKPKKEEEILSDGEEDHDNFYASTSLPLTTIETYNIKIRPNEKKKVGEKIKIDEQNILLLYSALLKDYCDLGNKIPQTNKEKESFLRKIIPAIRQNEILPGTELYNEFLNIFSAQLSMGKEEFTTLFEYEIFKPKIDTLFSTFSKSLIKFFGFVKDSGITDISDLKIVLDIPRLKDCFDTTIFRLISYKQYYNDYFGKFNFDYEKLADTLEKYIPGIREKNLEYLSKIAYKFEEVVEKNRIIYDIDTIIDYIRTNFSVTSEFKKDTAKSEVSIEDLLVFQKENKQINSVNTESNLSSSRVGEKKKKILNERTEYKIQRVPILSHIYYTCDFNPNDF